MSIPKSNWVMLQITRSASVLITYQPRASPRVCSSVTGNWAGHQLHLCFVEIHYHGWRMQSTFGTVSLILWMDWSRIWELRENCILKETVIFHKNFPLLTLNHSFIDIYEGGGGAENPSPGLGWYFRRLANIFFACFCCADDLLLPEARACQDLWALCQQ